MKRQERKTDLKARKLYKRLQKEYPQDRDIIRAAWKDNKSSLERRSVTGKDADPEGYGGFVLLKKDIIDLYMT